LFLGRSFVRRVSEEAEKRGIDYVVIDESGVVEADAGHRSMHALPGMRWA
jgi:hypothetical protein